MPIEETFRPKFMRAVAVVVVGGVGALLAGVLVREGWAAALRDAGPLGLFGWAGWVLLWRPSLAVGRQGVVVRNPLRTVTIPWPAVRSLDTRYALTFTTAARRWTSYAATAPGRGSVRKLATSEVQVLGPVVDEDGTISAGDLPESDSGRAQLLVRRYWQDHRFADPDAREHAAWHVPAVALGVALLALTVAGALL